MNKCSKCGTEYEGNFCPECGTKFEATKYCPKCGAECNSLANFCNNCGYLFKQQTAQTTAKVKDKFAVKKAEPKATPQLSQPESQSKDFNPKNYRKIGQAFTLAPFILVNLFWVLSFISMSCEMASMGVGWGSIYQNVNDWEYSAYAITCVVLTAVGMVIGLVYTGFSHNKSRFVYQLVGGLSLVPILAQLILASVWYDNLLQQGFDVGVAIKLLIAFDVLLFVVIGGCISWDVRLMFASGEYRQAVKSLSENNIVYNRFKFLHKLTKSNKQDNGVGNSLFNARQNNDSKNGFEKFLSFIAFAIVDYIFCMLIVAMISLPIRSIIAGVGKIDTFFVTKVSSLTADDIKSSYTLTNKFGEPDEQDGQIVIYYGRYFKNLLDKQTKLNKLMTSSDDYDDPLETLEKAMRAQVKLDRMKGDIVDKRLYINTSTGYVELNRKYSVNGTWDKAVSKVTVGDKNTVDVSSLYNDTIVKIRYKGRCYRRIVLPENVQAVDLVKQSANSLPTSATLVFSDNYGDYRAEVKFTKSNDFKIPASWRYYDGTLTFDLDNYKTIRVNTMLGVDVTCYDKVQKIELEVPFLPDFNNTIYDPSFVRTITCDTDAFVAEYGILFDKEAKKVLYIPACNTSLRNTTWYKNQKDGALYADNVFYGYKGMSDTNSLNIYDGTQEIAPNALNVNSDSGFSDINIPNSVKKIGFNAFAGNVNLDSVYYRGTIEDWCKIRFESAYSNPMSYASHFILKDGIRENEVTELVIPNDITQIGDYQFYGMSNVTSVFLPNSLQTIGRYAFYGIKGSTENGLSYIGNADNPYLVLLGSEGEQAAQMTELTVSDKTRFVVSLQGLTELQTLILPDSVEYLDQYAASGLSNLQSVTLSANISVIQPSTFQNCIALTEVVIPQNSKLFTIERNAFYGCTALNALSLPPSLNIIMFNAFDGCRNLRSVTFDNTDGWSVNTSYWNGFYKLTLTDPEQNATLLRYTYVDCSWTRF